MSIRKVTPLDTVIVLEKQIKAADAWEEVAVALWFLQRAACICLSRLISGVCVHVSCHLNKLSLVTEPVKLILRQECKRTSGPNPKFQLITWLKHLLDRDIGNLWPFCCCWTTTPISPGHRPCWLMGFGVRQDLKGRWLPSHPKMVWGLVSFFVHLILFFKLFVSLKKRNNELLTFDRFHTSAAELGQL